MKNKYAISINFNALNDDCLRLIFTKLTLIEQVNLSQISARYAYIIADIWLKCEHSKVLDFHRTAYFKLFEVHDLRRYFKIIQHKLQQIINVNAKNYSKLLKNCNDIIFENCNTLTIAEHDFKISNMAAIEMTTQLTKILPHLRTLKVQNIKIMLNSNVCKKLQTLVLMNATFVANQDLSITNLSSLHNLTMLPPSKCGTLLLRTPRNDKTWSTSLHTLKLTIDQLLMQTAATQLSVRSIGQLSVPVSADPSATQLSFLEFIAKLSNLRTLNIFCAEATTDLCAKQRIIAHTLRTFRMPQIVAVTLSCHFDRSLLCALQRMQCVRKFRWHSHLHVAYDGAAHELKWQAYDAQLTPAIFRLLATYEDLRELDVRDNRHMVTMCQRRQLQQLVETRQRAGKAALHVLQNTDEEVKNKEIGDQKKEVHTHAVFREEMYNGCGYMAFEFS